MHPGTLGNSATSRCHDGSRCPDHGPLGETGSLDQRNRGYLYPAILDPVPVGCVSPFPGSMMGRQPGARGSYYSWTYTWTPFTQLPREGRACPPSSHSPRGELWSGQTSCGEKETRHWTTSRGTALPLEAGDEERPGVRPGISDLGRRNRMEQQGPYRSVPMQSARGCPTGVGLQGCHHHL